MLLHYLPEMSEGTWTFLTNHTHVLLCIRRDPDMRLRDIAEAVGITERATHRIICDLKDAGYLEVEKDGRRNHYVVRGDLPLRHPLERTHTAGELVDLLTPNTASVRKLTAS